MFPLQGGIKIPPQMGTLARANEERVLRDCVQGESASRRQGGVLPVREKTGLLRRFAPRNDIYDLLICALAPYWT